MKPKNNLPSRFMRIVQIIGLDRELRRRAKSEAKFLRPGLYLRDGDTLWRRTGASVPGHARRTKGSRNAGQALRMFQSITSWFLVARGSHDTGEIVVAAFDGGTVVLNPSKGCVRRKYGTGPVSPQYIDWRRRFSAHVTTPAFEVSPDRQTVTEELVDGSYLLDVDFSTRISALRLLLRQYTALTRSEGRPDNSSAGVELRRAFSETVLPKDFDGVFSRCHVGRLDQPIAWVPSAFEATAKNLLVSKDGEPVPIDLGDLRMEPCFSYPIGVITSAGPDVLEHYLRGTFDDALEDLLCAGGQTFRPDLFARAGLLLERLAYGALCDARLFNGVDGKVFEKSLMRRWDEISPLMSLVVDEERH